MILLKGLGDMLEFLAFPKHHSKGIIVHSFMGKALKSQLKSNISNFPLPSQKKNLVWKAAHAFYKTSKIKPNIHIQLHKNVPFGSGLGSGSSNAAYTLMTLNQIHRYPLSQKKLVALASSLGSDIPFFLFKKAAFVFGQGEKIRRRAVSPKGWFLIINPGFQISTPWAYNRWDQLLLNPDRSLTKKKRNVTNGAFESKEVPPAAKEWMTTKQKCKNDFEQVVYPAYPMLEKARNKLLEFKADIASLSGSGPSLFGVFKTRLSAQRAAAYFNQKKWLVWITQGV